MTCRASTMAGWLRLRLTRNVRLFEEGVAPALIENAGRMAGMLVGFAGGVR